MPCILKASPMFSPPDRAICHERSLHVQAPETYQGNSPSSSSQCPSPLPSCTACHQHRLQCLTRPESRCHCSLFVSSHGSISWWKDAEREKFSFSPLSLRRATASMYLTMHQAKPMPTCSVGSPRVLPFISMLTCSLPHCTLPSSPCLSSKPLFF